jgi:type IV pilus biogenesis protein CpaD/CtpE
MTTMLALTCALLAACGEHKPDSPPTRDSAVEAAEKADAAVEAARDDATKTKPADLQREQLEWLAQATADMTAKVNKALAAVGSANTAADRAAAKAKLADLQLEQARLRVRFHRAMEVAVKAAKLRPPPRPPVPGPRVPKPCLDHAVAKGCR